MKRVLLNGEPRDFEEGTTLASLVDGLKLPSGRIAVEVNLDVIRKKAWQEVTINEGDRIEVVHFVGGG